MARYLITGGAGFIGSHLVERLIDDGEDVRVIDNFLTGLRSNLEPFQGKFEMVEADIRDADAVKRAMTGVDYVLHQAALPSVPRSVENPLETHSICVDGTLHVLEAARDAGVKRVVYAASSSAYGDLDVDLKHEELRAQPVSPYGVAKVSAEMYCHAFYRVYGLETVCLRYFNVFGPRQNHNSAYTGVVAIFIPQMLQGKRPTVTGNGAHTRDYTFVRNNVEANLTACTAPDAAGEVINIACSERRSVLDIVNEINEVLGTDLEPEFLPPRPGDILHSRADIAKAERILNFKPSVSFREGLAITVDWYREALGL